MKKAIFIDLDGTLLNSSDEISKRNKKAVKKAIASGFDIIIATGKSFRQASKYYDELKLNTWFITSLGQLISKPDLGKVHKRFIEYKIVKKVYEENKDIIENFLIQTTNKNYVLNKEDITNKIITNDIISFDCFKDIDSIIGFYVKTKKGVPIETPLMDVFPWDTGTDTNLFALRRLNTSKLKAIKFIMDLEEYSKIYMMGNGRSDLPAMKFANKGIAMANSQEQVLAEAPYISKYTNDEDAVAKEIDIIINIDK